MPVWGNKDTWETELLYGSELDGKNILEIEKIIQYKRLENNFRTWLGIFRGYTGVALPAIMRNLYDFAETLEDFQALETSEPYLVDLIAQSIKNIEQGLSKIHRVKDPREFYCKDNLLDMLDQFALNVDCSVKNKISESDNFHSELLDFLAYIEFQYGFILKYTIQQKADNKGVLKLWNNIVLLYELQNEEYINQEVVAYIYKDMQECIKYAIDFEQKRLDLLVEIQELEENKKSQLKEIYLKMDEIRLYKNERSKSKKNNSKAVRVEKNIEKLQQEYHRYEVKYRKVLKEQNQDKANKIFILMQEIENKITKEQQELSVPIDDQPIKNININDHKWLSECIQWLQQSENDFKNFVTLHNLVSQQIPYLQFRLAVLQQQLEFLNHKTPSFDLIQKSYNILRNHFLDDVKHIFLNIKSILNGKKFNHQDFYTFAKFQLSICTQASPLDIKVTVALLLIQDFFTSYCMLYEQNRDCIEDIDQILARFEFTLEKGQSYLDLAEEKQEFISVDNVPSYTSYFDVSVVQMNESESILDQTDSTVIDNNLYPYLVKTLYELKKDKILIDTEIERLRDQLDVEKLKIYEQIISFDLDEFVNSVQNSLNSAYRFKQKGIIPPEYYQHLTSSFEFEVVRLSDESIPNRHEFYQFINDTDKLDLVSLVKKIISFNNIYQGVNIKIAHTLCSKSELSFLLKEEIYNLTEKFSNQYFYGLYTKNLEEIKRYQYKFIYNFITYLTDIGIEFKNNSIVLVYFELFYNSLIWFVYNASSYGGIALYQNQKIQILSERMYLLQGYKENDLVARKIAYSHEHAKMLMDEYYTSFCINHIDLRFRKGFNKYTNLATYKKEILNLAIDLREMRRLLVKNFKASDTIIKLDIALMQHEKKLLGCTDCLYALWQWETTGDSLGRICIDVNYENMLIQSKKASRMDATYKRLFRINWNGQLSAIETPWLDATKMELVNVEVAEDLNLYLLQIFHEMFYQQYLETAEKVKQRIQQNIIVEETVIEQSEIVHFDLYDYEMIQLHHVLQKEILQDDTSKQSQKQLRTYFNCSMKSSKFFKLLENKFDVVIRQGKGSEINVSRVTHGGKIHRLGHHGKMVEYSAGHIRDILKRLNIRLEDWIMALV